MPGSKDNSWLVAMQCAAVLAVLLLWQLASSTGLVSTASVASPQLVAHALLDLAASQEFWNDLAATLRSWALGLTLSAAIGIPMGLVLGSSDFIYRSLRVTVEFIRATPPVALIPLLLLLYGATAQMAVMLIVIGSMWPILMQTMYGVHQVDPLTRDVAASYRLRRQDRLLRVQLPAVAPFIVTGLRIAATMSLLMAIGAELIAGAPGIGYMAGVAQADGDLGMVYAFIVVTAVLSILINRGMRFAERRLLHWHPSHRPAQ
jgi:ABC-type nitrate/sulfonate/bicarbonate transport system permease component